MRRTFLKAFVGAIGVAAGLVVAAEAYWLVVQLDQRRLRNDA